MSITSDDSLFAHGKTTVVCFVCPVQWAEPIGLREGLLHDNNRHVGCRPQPPAGDN